MGFCRQWSQTPEGALDSMAQEVRHFSYHQREDYQDDFISLSRVHLGVYNPDKQPFFLEERVGIFGEGMTYDDSGEQRDWPRKALESFRRSGAEGLRELNGSYSFVVFDEPAGKVHLVSDRFGTRPMYYWWRGGDFAFANEPRAILKFPGCPKRLDPVGVYKYFRYGRLCIFGDDTWFEGVKGLPPGSVLTFDGRSVVVEKYWEPAYYHRAQGSLEELAHTLTVRFRKAVEVRTSNPRTKYSVALSGGLDSRAVLAGLKRPSTATSYTFGTVGSPEISIAHKVAEKAGVRHLVCHLDPEKAAAFVDDVVSLSSGLEVVGIAVLLQADTELRPNVDVSIDGYALDLTLGGSFLNKAIMEAKSVQELGGILDSKFAVVGDGELPRLFTEEYVREMGTSAKAEFHRSLQESAGETVPDKADNFALRTRVRNFTVMGHVLSRNYFEDTFPTLDNGLVETILGVPPRLRHHNRLYRRFLRELTPSLSAIQYERTGVSPNRPFAVWMLGIIYSRVAKDAGNAVYGLSRGRLRLFKRRGYFDLAVYLRTSPAWRTLVSETIASKGALIYKRGIMRRDYVLRVVRDHTSGAHDYRELILYLITFELVLRKFFPDST